ncbi:molecular chaperone HtpG [Paratractidigestivibacter sp.]|uniref:molecular chaperone HtpG n=1 Tax=Paratractidigestivibacter sp. TaxID=2847316 RepID=UPI002AC96166|nr:molecular chaperone HtpG [Paratractidigestivibacter sp.]
MRKFKTESKKLLDLMINSIYTNREIFLRELISNASDAIDKLYLKSLTDASANVDQANLAITLTADKDARTITVSDNGIGMTAEELEKNLGTIAHSGSEEFKAENAEAQGDAVDIIGRFGVGFYSAFMVAKEVSVVTRAFGSDECNRWTSDGVEGYTISAVPTDDPAYRATCGTDVIMALKDNTDDASYDEYTSEYTLKDLVKRYSNYVRYPVQMMVTKSRQKEKPADAGDDYKPEWESYEELETLNSMTPIWKKRAADVEQSEYDEFYKSTFHDWEAPARTFSLHAEGSLEYDALLFIPGKAPFDLYSRDYEKGLELYSSNVLIMEKCADLVPDYYNFVRGVVDSSDITLNISRETLQQNRQLQVMARRIEKKITSELEAMRDNDREAYEKFFDNFGRGIKYGIYSSYGMKKDELAGLLFFWSAKNEKFVTLQEYAEGMVEGQSQIYYAAGDDRDRLAKMPVVKAALAKGYDVLLCTADVDEFCFQAMRDFTATGLAKVYEDDAAREAAEKAQADGAEAETEDRALMLKNVSSGDLDLATDEEKTAAEKTAKANEGLFGAMKDTLDGAVAKVTVSAHLTGEGDAPSCVTAEGPVSLEMEQVLAAGPDGGENAPKATRVLEVNASHPVFAKLQAAQEAGDAEKLALYTSLLYDQALLTEGLPVADPVAFAQNVCKLM